MTQENEPVAGNQTSGGGEAPAALPQQALAEPDAAGNIKELELRFAEQTQKAEGLGRSLQEMEGKLQKAQGDLGEATLRYKTLVFALHPDIPPELISGASIAEIDASVEKAAALVQKIKEAIMKQGKVPAGAPVRSSPDWSGLSPRDKIKAGMMRK